MPHFEPKKRNKLRYMLHLLVIIAQFFTLGLYVKTMLRKFDGLTIAPQKPLVLYDKFHRINKNLLTVS